MKKFPQELTQSKAHKTTLVDGQYKTYRKVVAARKRAQIEKRLKKKNSK